MTNSDGASKDEICAFFTDKHHEAKKEILVGVNKRYGHTPLKVDYVTGFIIFY